jgi:hypothetical protein
VKSPRALVSLFVPLALAACGAEPETPAESSQPAAQAEPADPPAEEAAPAPDPAAATLSEPEPDRWLLTEFDWGDSEEIVYESVNYTDGFLCYKHKLRKHCAFVKTKVDGEELLAKFDFVDGVLWRIEVLTPNLDPSQADPHLERIWKLLVDYVTRFQGEAPEQQDFPQRESLRPGQEVVTRRWQLPDQEIRIVVGRAAAGQKWFTSARFIDPKWAKESPPPPPPENKAAAPAS